MWSGLKQRAQQARHSINEIVKAANEAEEEDSLAGEEEPGSFGPRGFGGNSGMLSEGSRQGSVAQDGLRQRGKAPLRAVSAGFGADPLDHAEPVRLDSKAAAPTLDSMAAAEASIEPQAYPKRPDPNIATLHPASAALPQPPAAPSVAAPGAENAYALQQVQILQAQSAKLMAENRAALDAHEGLKEQHRRQQAELERLQVELHQAKLLADGPSRSHVSPQQVEELQQALAQERQERTPLASERENLWKQSQQQQEKLQSTLTELDGMRTAAAQNEVLPAVADEGALGAESPGEKERLSAEKEELLAEREALVSEQERLQVLNDLQSSELEHLHAEVTRLRAAGTGTSASRLEDDSRGDQGDDSDDDEERLQLLRDLQMDDSFGDALTGPTERVPETAWEASPERQALLDEKEALSRDYTVAMAEVDKLQIELRTLQAAAASTPLAPEPSGAERPGVSVKEDDRAKELEARIRTLEEENARLAELEDEIQRLSAENRRLAELGADVALRTTREQDGDGGGGGGRRAELVESLDEVHRQNTAEMEREVERLTTEAARVMELEAELTQLREERQSMRAEETATRASTEASGEEMAALRAKLGQSEQEKDAIAAEREKWRDKTLGLQEDVGRLRAALREDGIDMAQGNRVGALEHELETLRTKMHQAAETERIREQAVAMTEAKLRGLEDMMTAYEQENEALRDRDDERNRVLQELNERVEQLVAREQEHDAEVQKLSEESHRLDAELASARQAKDTAEQRLETQREEQSREASSERERLEARLAASGEELKRLSELHASAAARLEAETRRAQEQLQAETAKREEIVLELRAEVERREADGAAAAHSTAAVEAKLVAAEALAASLQLQAEQDLAAAKAAMETDQAAEKERWTARLSEADAHVGSLSAQMERVREETAATTARLEAELEASRRAREGEEAGREAALTSTTAELAEASAARDAAEAKLKSAEEALLSSEAASREEIVVLRADLAKRRAADEQVWMNRVSELEAEAESLRTESQTLRRERETAERQWEEDHAMEISILEQTLQDLRSSVASKDSELAAQLESSQEERDRAMQALKDELARVEADRDEGLVTTRQEHEQERASWLADRAQLEGALEELRTDRDRVQDAMRGLEDERAGLDQSAQEARDVVDRLQAEKEAVDAALARVEEDRAHSLSEAEARHAARVAELEAALADTTSRAASLDDESTRKVADAEDRVAEYQEEVEALRAERREGIRAQKELLAERTDELEALVESVQQQLSSAASGHAEEVERWSAEVERWKAAAEEGASKLELEKSELAQQVVDADRQRLEAETQAEQLRARAEAGEGEVTQLRTDVERHYEELEAVKLDLEQARRSQLREVEEQLAQVKAELEERLIAVQDERDGLLAREEETKQVCEQYRREIADLQASEAARKEAEVGGLRAEKETALIAQREAEAKVRSLKDEKEALCRERASVQEERDELVRAQTESAAQLASRESDLAALRAATRDLEGSATTPRDAELIDELRERVTTLEGARDAEEAQRLALERQLTGSRAQVEDLRKEAAQLRTEKDALRQEIMTDTVPRSELAVLQERLTSADLERDQLVQAAEARDGQLTTLEGKNEALRVQLEAERSRGGAAMDTESVGRGVAADAGPQEDPVRAQLEHSRRLSEAKVADLEQRLQAVESERNSLRYSLQERQQAAQPSPTDGSGGGVPEIVTVASRDDLDGLRARLRTAEMERANALQQVDELRNRLDARLGCAEVAQLIWESNFAMKTRRSMRNIGRKAMEQDWPATMDDTVRSIGVAAKRAYAFLEERYATATGADKAV